MFNDFFVTIHLSLSFYTNGTVYMVGLLFWYHDGIIKSKIVYVAE